MTVLNWARPEYLADPAFDAFERRAAQFIDAYLKPGVLGAWTNRRAVNSDIRGKAVEIDLLALALPMAGGGAGGDIRGQVRSGGFHPIMKRLIARPL